MCIYIYVIRIYVNMISTKIKNIWKLLKVTWNLHCFPVSLPGARWKRSHIRNNRMYIHRDTVISSRLATKNPSSVARVAQASEGTSRYFKHFKVKALVLSHSIFCGQIMFIFPQHVHPAEISYESDKYTIKNVNLLLHIQHKSSAEVLP